MSNLDKQLNHPFYAASHEFRAEVELETMKKAAKKYPEPFNPHSWTNEQLAKHAMAENYDQQNYIFGMFEKLKWYESELAKIKEENETLKQAIAGLRYAGGK